MKTRSAIEVPFVALVVLGLTLGIPALASPQGAMGHGTEGRRWVEGPLPDPIPAARYELEIREHVKIPMRDGVRLDAVLYIPDVPAPAGCILVADGYGWSFDSRDRRFAEERGYAVLNVSYRGIDESEGEAGLYDHFGQDGFDLVEWMAKQPWCDGNVGAFGSSLPGIPLWLIAREAPPSLKAIAPDVACGDCYEYLWYPGGMAPGPGRESRARHEYVAAIQHRDFNEWWQAQTTRAEHHGEMARRGLGIMVTGGWGDYITPGNVQAFGEFAAAGGNGRLLIDPGAHSSARRSIIGPYYHHRHMDLFFDHFLRGARNEWVDGTFGGDAVIWVHGPDRYRYEETWPIPDTRRARLYLGSEKSGSIGSANDGSLVGAAPATGVTPVSYDYFPGVGPFLPAMRTSNAGIPAGGLQVHETAAATWTSGQFPVPTEITGTMTLDFWASSTAADTDFVLLVTDVAPDGTSTFVTAGFLNGPRHPDRSRPRPLVPGEIRSYSMETQANAYVFQAGHRLRISLAGGAEGLPDQRTPQGPGKNPNFSHVTIYQDAQHPSSLTLPVIGTARLPGEEGR